MDQNVKNKIIFKMQTMMSQPSAPLSQFQPKLTSVSM